MTSQSQLMKDHPVKSDPTGLKTALAILIVITAVALYIILQATGVSDKDAVYRPSPKVECSYVEGCYPVHELEAHHG